MGVGQKKLEFTVPGAFSSGERGYAGNILHVDLNSGEMNIEQPGEAFYRKYIGGRGVILHYLLDQMPVGADPLGPDNLLIFASGVLTGTILPGTGRHAVGGKSPLTGVLASGEAGGWWGHELKRVGLDALVIRGTSPSPVYLAVENGIAELRDAGHLWGLSTGETQAAIRQELDNDKVRVAQIGIGGENQVRYAAVMHDINRAAGRSGLGAVMGSKRLKAVTVQGSHRVGLVDKSALQDTLKWITGNYQQQMKWAVDYGTPVRWVLTMTAARWPTGIIIGVFWKGSISSAMNIFSPHWSLSGIPAVTARSAVKLWLSMISPKLNPATADQNTNHWGPWGLYAG